MDASVLLDLFDPLHHGIEGYGHGLVHQRRFMSLHVVRRPAIAAEELVQFLRLDTREDGRVGNLVAVKMEDWQHRSVGGRIEKFVGMPRRGQRCGLRLAIADDAGDDEIGIVEHSPERMTERIAQFAALMD